MCHPWQQYLEHLKLEPLLGSPVVVGLAIKRAHKYLRHVGFTDQSVGRCTKAMPLLVKGILFLVILLKISLFLMFTDKEDFF